MQYRKFLFVCCLAGLGFRALLAAAEDDMSERVAVLEKRVRELEAQTVLSLPELIVKENKAYVCEKGHGFNRTQEANKCPHDGSRVAVQTTYQKEKYFRRKSIEDKIEEALADIQPVSIGISATALGFHTFGTGRGVNAPQPKNDLYGSGSFDLSLSAKPAAQTVIFIDLEALVDSGARTRIPSYSSLNSDANRLAAPTQNEELKIREAWISTSLGDQREWTVTAGSMDMVTVFDQNLLANDETVHFVSDVFVNNPFFAPPANGAGVAVIYDPKGPYALKFGAQRIAANIRTSKIGGRLFSAAELHLRARPWRGWQNGNYRFWLRANGETDRRENITFGVSLDQRISRTISFFGRYGSQRTQNANVLDANGKPVFPGRDDSHYSVGFEVRGPELTWLPRDVWGMACGRTEIRSVQGQEFLINAGPGENETLVEAYYKIFITEHLHATPFVQWLADSVRAESTGTDDLVLGLRTQVDF